MTARAAEPVRAAPALERGIGVGGATVLNMIDMIGVGPFITIPLIVSAVGGPQAIFGWIAGALLAICDGLVWAELGAAMPRSGGSYHYLSEIYGPRGLGRLLSFLFIWQLSFSAPLSIASGCIGLAQYASYLFQPLGRALWSRTFALDLPVLGTLRADVLFSGATVVAIAACVLAALLLYRRITTIGAISKLLLGGVLAAIAIVVWTGATHFRSALAFDFPAGAFTLGQGFFLGYGAALLVATYDFWGYYNVCFIGDELKDPARTMPRALLYSILGVTAIYLVMNISILGVVPWRELIASSQSDARFYVISSMVERVYGHGAAVMVTLLIMWTAFASVFSLMLGYSRVPYAAALDGNYFRAFARVHPTKHIPHVSLAWLAIAAGAFCFLRLADVIAALVVIRISLQFLLQTVGVIVLRIRRPEMPRPFRMWLYPLPALLATAGFLFVLVYRPGFQKELRYAALILIAGVVLFFLRGRLEAGIQARPKAAAQS
ncbi:MAG TPA: APC family permease [Terriglobales bacterium]|nr:APC family permease [Terriglobales bacterium]